MTEAWDDVRRRARKLESELHGKLGAYSKLANSNRKVSGKPSDDDDSDNEPQNVSEVQITALLQKLGEVVDEMSAFVEGKNDVSFAHTQQRFRTVLADFSRDFRKTQEALRTQRMRTQLFAPEGSPGSGSGSGGLRPRTEHMLREQDSLHTSIRMADELVQQGMTAREKLHTANHGVLSTVGRSLDQLGRRFPAVNILIGKVQAHRQRDLIVMAFVVAMCLLFTLYLITR